MRIYLYLSVFEEKQKKEKKEKIEKEIEKEKKEIICIHVYSIQYIVY